ncbi:MULTISPECIES: helix-turn-helix transcriptional regulator [Vagococcus]|uniref:HTH cro/C1-type domain-containing protein n=1 Tax=Vagococcus fluvialis bH819 TaxID=1255619 RepID=A0A1X6WS99_9ENTE|nr:MULTISPECIES: helix-turn-helix transcriptional regulator [Vagococcus]SLM87112.1 hypothetical protein FM121_13520 [Vagococcus fluvialis bH819]HCM90607.1 XRE family transcriptional regulator [Vagococcus sp.]
MKYSEIKKRMIDRGQTTELDLQLIEIVNAIKFAREDKKITQVEIAEKTGMSQVQYSKFENYYNRPTLETVVRVLNALDFDVANIFSMGIEQQINKGKQEKAVAHV